jgi:hypothetical protein
MEKAESNSSKQTDGAVTTQGLDGNSSKELSKNSEVKYVEKSDRNFTLQEYVDKAGAYMEDKEPTSGTSNVKKLESMPVIGK